jgi:hypothetical protein
MEIEEGTPSLVPDGVWDLVEDVGVDTESRESLTETRP